MATALVQLLVGIRYRWLCDYWLLFRRLICRIVWHSLWFSEGWGAPICVGPAFRLQRRWAIFQGEYVCSTWHCFYRPLVCSDLKPQSSIRGWVWLDILYEVPFALTDRVLSLHHRSSSFEVMPRTLRVLVALLTVFPMLVFQSSLLLMVTFKYLVLSVILRRWPLGRYW